MTRDGRRPDGPRLGLAGTGRAAVGELVLGAWDAVLDQAAEADLHRDSRLRGWRAQEICVHLGAWPDHRVLDDLVASAGSRAEPPDVDLVNARAVAAHRDAPRAEVLAALGRARDATRRYLADAPAELDATPTPSVLGRVPLLTLVLGQAYELAVHGLDLVSCGAPPPRASLLDAGLAALADLTGALAADCGITGAATLRTPAGGWSFAAEPDGWSVTRVPTGPATGPTVEGRAGLLLEAAAGRVNPVPAAARRELRVHDAAGLLVLAPIAQRVPGMPGGPVLQLAARTLGGAGGLLGRLLR